MFYTLRSRLWLTYALVAGVVLCILGFGLGIYLLRNPLPVRESYLRLRFLAATASQRAGNQDNLQPEQIQRAAERLHQEYGVWAVLFDQRGKQIYNSQPDQGQNPGFPAPARVSQTITNGRFRDASGQVWLYVLNPVDKRYSLLLAFPKPTTTLANLLQNEFTRPFLEAGLVALTLSLILAFWIARWIAAPLQQLSRGARQLAAGEYRPIEPEGPGEVQALSRAFNNMAARVESARQSERELIANVSHELKTPLTSIHGFAEAILDGTADNPEELRQAAAVIHAESERMRKMVMELLDLARLDAGMGEMKRERVDLIEVLQGVIEAIKPVAQQSNSGISFDFQPLPPITGDMDRLTQAFSNLVDNALKYSPAGGKVRLRAWTEGGQIKVSVEDNGPGIPKEDQEHIFERFYQVDKSRPGGERQGAGLGLAIARQIVRAHRGDIQVESSPGRGTKFVVKIPFA